MTKLYNATLRMGDAKERTITTDEQGAKIIEGIMKGEGLPNGRANINTYGDSGIDELYSGTDFSGVVMKCTEGELGSIIDMKEHFKKWREV